MGSVVSIRPAGEPDFDALTDVWERAARSTHSFMDDSDFVANRPYIRDLYLPSMDVWAAVEDDEPIGFVGARESHVELLYIAPEAQGRGIGTALLAHVAGGEGPSSVEVYADNTAGLGFYLSQGFHETRRYPTDAAGRAFAIVHLERTGGSA
jgi:putative acetyltransferase